MENATKALLIAAAVLVVILIISLGIGIFNSASEQVDNAGNLSEYEIQAFNDKFLKYEGENLSASSVNAMLKTVMNHNVTQEDETTCVSVDVDLPNVHEETYIDNTPNINNSPRTVSTAYRFKVFCIVNRNSKLVEHIVAKVIT